MDIPANSVGILTTEAAAAYTGLSVSMLNKLRLTGGGSRFAKLGRRVVYRTADLDDWIASRLVSSTSERIAV